MDRKAQLIKDRIRAHRSAPDVYDPPTFEQMADRIEELEAELILMKTSGVVEVSVRNPSVMEYMQHWEGRAETAEAKLAKAIKFAEIVKRTGHGELEFLAVDMIAKLKGEIDE